MAMRWEEMIPGTWFLGWGVLWMIMITAFWLLVLMGLPQEESALEILKKRYARGEIGKEEYEAKKRDLA
jgi:putative membrane protein